MDHFKKEKRKQTKQPKQFCISQFVTILFFLFLLFFSKSSWKTIKFRECSHYHCPHNSVGLIQEGIRPISSPWNLLSLSILVLLPVQKTFLGEEQMVPFWLILGISVGPPSLPLCISKIYLTYTDIRRK